jgi:SRSO17 transposase
MERERTFAAIGRQAGTPEQNSHHCMSQSPWAVRPLLGQVQREIAVKPGLARGGLRLLDESADARAGPRSAGAARQDNGRLGKVEVSQVGVFLAYGNRSPAPEAAVWTWIDGERFLPEGWFAPEKASERQRLGLPAERRFATKVALGWQLVQRAQAPGLPCEAVCCADRYGRATWFRRRLRAAGIHSMAAVSVTTQVSLTRPTTAPVEAPGLPGAPGAPGAARQAQVLTAGEPVAAGAVFDRPDTVRRRVPVRATERGVREAEVAVRRVWPDRDEPGVPTSEEGLVLRREAAGDLSCSLSNAPPAATLDRLAWLTGQRSFGERANQDAKRELGWDDFRAQKDRAWEHPLALTVLASWSLAETKLDGARQAARDPALAHALAVEALPQRSAANVRELLRAALPLSHRSPEHALALVVQHLLNRTRARKSRLKRRHQHASAPSPPM